MTDWQARAEAAETRASDLQAKLDDAHDREAQIALQRNEWVRLFNRVEAAVRRHMDEKHASGFRDEHDESLHAGYERILRDAHQAEQPDQRNEWEARAVRAEEELSRYRERERYFGVPFGDWERLTARMRQRDRAVEALRFYADQNNYDGNAPVECRTADDGEDGGCEYDVGRIARVALAEVGKHHPRVPARPTVSTTDAARAPRESSSTDSAQDTGERDDD